MVNEYKETETTKSPIWIWFEKKNQEIARCKICKTDTPTKSFSTSNLIIHLKRHHGFLKKPDAWKVYEELSSLKEERIKTSKRKNSDVNHDEPKAKQPKIGTAFNPPYGPHHPRQQNLNNAVASMICRDGIPTNIVARAGFKNLASQFDSRYTLPNSTTFQRKIIPDLKNVVHAHQKEKIKIMLETESSMAFSTDGLDGNDTDQSSIYDFTIYFYDGDEICTEVVYVKGLESPCTGEVIAKFLLDCLTDIEVIGEDGSPKLDIWGITDEGANILRALKILKENGTILGYHNCWTHKLQNTVKDGIKVTEGIHDTLELFKANAAMYSRSRIRRKELREIGELHKEKVSFPVVPNATRWFALLMMADGFLKFESIFKFHFMESPHMRKPTAADWKKLRGFSDVLKPFQTASRIAEGEKYLTLSSIIPMLSILREKTIAYTKDPLNRGFGVTFARNLLASLDDRFGRHPDFLLRKPYCLATFSDPRWSWIYYKQCQEMEFVKENILIMAKEEMESMEEDKEDVQPPASTQEVDTFWGDLEQTAPQLPSSHRSIESEARLWAGVSRPSRLANPIHVMNGLKNDFPRVFKIFRKYSIFPATQNKSERLFSMIGRMTRPQCRNVKVETIETKAVVGAAIQKHGFIFDYNKAKNCSPNESSSDDESF